MKQLMSGNKGNFLQRSLGRLSVAGKLTSGYAAILLTLFILVAYIEFSLQGVQTIQRPVNNISATLTF